MKFTKSMFFRTRIHPVLAKIPIYDYYLLRKKSYLKTAGWFKSFREEASIDNEGNPIPWFTYAAIEFLKERIPEDVTVFEYGSGMGTLWWASKVKQVDVVEDDEKWMKMIEPKLSGNVNIMHRTPDNTYSSAIEESKSKYDVIIVDGKIRNECCKKAIHCLSEKGVLILDDSQRESQMDSIDLLKSNGFKQLKFKGLKPIEFISSETSIFYKTGSILDL